MAIPIVQFYEYLPLPSNTSIRLLRLLSGPDEQIRYSLEIVDLHYDPPYDCLSYTWGDPLYHDLSASQGRKKTTNEPKFSITCSGLIIRVTENLHEALLQLSRRPHQRQSAIWIDSICIDQKNDLEKNTQVAMMHRINKSARRVFVWLGIADAHTKPAIDVMSRLSKVPRKRATTELPFNLDNSELYRLLGISDIEPQQWLDFAAFLQRSWFSRMWVIQETAVAEDIVVLCGAYTLPWLDITASAELLQKTRLGELLAGDVTKAIDFSVMSTRYVANVLTNPFIFENVRRKAKSLTLEMLLVYSKYFKATDDRDRVFAILGLWEQALEHRGFTHHLRPDYRLKVEEVYSTAAAATIHEMGDLNLLSLVEDFSFRKLKDLPSWVPDYSVPPHAHPLTNNVRAAPGKERWKASNGLPFTIPAQREFLLLPINGIQVDIINTFAATETDITSQHQFTSLLDILLRMLDTSYPGGSTPIEAFWRTLVKDTFRTQPAGSETRTIFPSLIIFWVQELKDIIGQYHADAKSHCPETDLLEAQIQELAMLSNIYKKAKAMIHTLSLRQDINGIIPTWSTIRKSIKNRKRHDKDDKDRYPEMKQFDRDLDAIKESFRTAYSSRRLFVTNHEYIGIAAESLQRGDSIWVVAGAAVPIVLRRLPSGNWKLVGEAYVHGLMNGEVVRELAGRVEQVVLE